MGEQHESSIGPRAARTASDARSLHRSDNPQVKLLHRPPAFHDPPATAGREMREHRGLTTGPEAIGEAFRPAASMIFGQAPNGLHAIKAILLATLGR